MSDALLELTVEAMLEAEGEGEWPRVALAFEYDRAADGLRGRWALSGTRSRRPVGPWRKPFAHPPFDDEYDPGTQSPKDDVEDDWESERSRRVGVGRVMPRAGGADAGWVRARAMSVDRNGGRGGDGSCDALFWPRMSWRE